MRRHKPQCSPYLARKLRRLGVTFDENGYAEYEELTTDPYGVLNWAVGNEDDFICFDHLVLPGGYVALESVVNSETGGFIDTFRYEIVRTEEAIDAAAEHIAAAWTWTIDNEVRHNRRESDRSGNRWLRAIKQDIARAK